MNVAFDEYLIAEQGGNCCGQDRFTVISCASCQGHYLFNEELNDLYYDPRDLRRRFFKIPGMNPPPCTYCGDIDWQFSDQQLNIVAIKTGPWGWLLDDSEIDFTRD